jgi:SAM-dependent methyltransferase
MSVWNAAQQQAILRGVSSPYTPDAFSRLDESDDREFYAQDRLVSHLDAGALATIEQLIEELVVEPEPVILDLMAGWDSHLPTSLKPKRVIGLGLNWNELESNPALDEFVIHDLNENPVLPFAEAEFDVVLNTVSVDYLTHPFEIFREVSRILKPGGLFLVIFSIRMFEKKAVKIWRESGEEERVLLVEDFFNCTDAFEPSRVFAVRGRPRPTDDKYAGFGLPSDPVYAVYADKTGRPDKVRPRPTSSENFGQRMVKNELRSRMAAVKTTLECPYCGTRLSKWQVPYDPFIEWQSDYMYICFNDFCPYFVRGWSVMYRDGTRGLSYRFMYDRDRDSCLSVPVPSRRALKDGIIS